MLADRRDELGRARTQTMNRLHRILLELFPGGAEQFLSAQQARALIATIKPRDLVDKTRRRIAVELIVISATEQASPSCRPHHVRRPRKPQSACTGSTATGTATTSSGAAAAAYTDTSKASTPCTSSRRTKPAWLPAPGLPTRRPPARRSSTSQHTAATHSRSRAPRSRKRIRSRSARERLLPAWATPLLPLAWATRQPPRRSHSGHASCPKGCPRSACGAGRPRPRPRSPGRAVG